MKNMTLWIAAFATLSSGLLRAQDIAVDWQGEAGRYRYVLHVTKPGSGGGNPTLTMIDRHLDWEGALPVTSLRF